jgi:hypothetical protein
MAYMVLLSFDDEEEALNFADAGLEGRLYYANERTSMAKVRDGEVEAIYKKPTMFCQTPGGCTSGGRRSGGFTMGQKWGWWVCSICGKPSQLWVESLLRKHSSFGKNLLDRLFDRETPV